MGMYPSSQMTRSHRTILWFNGSEQISVHNNDETAAAASSERENE